MISSEYYADKSMKNALFFAIFIFSIAFTISLQPVQVSAQSCGSIIFTQITKDIVCDGSPFVVRLENTNKNSNTHYWSGYQEAIFQPSGGINFNTFPDVDLTKVDSDTFDAIALCSGISDGTINVKLIGNGKTCTLTLELNSIYAPIKNDNGDIIVTDTKVVKETAEKNTFGYKIGNFLKDNWMIISLSITALLLMILIFLIIPRIRNRFINGHGKNR